MILLRFAILGLFLFLGGCSGGCPSIGCRPKVTLFYDSAILSPYSVSITINGVTLQASCPTAMQQFLPESDPPRVDSCDGNGITVSGIDLGHGANQTIGASVSIDNSAPILATAVLTNIANSRGCDTVCYIHSGRLPN